MSKEKKIAEKGSTAREHVAISLLAKPLNEEDKLNLNVEHDYILQPGKVFVIKFW